jgi:hypothetical protein
MPFLPDIDGEGHLIEKNPVPKLYTPPAKAKSVSFEADGMQRDKTHRKDAPTMENMHECVPNEAMQCVTCSRDMII